MLLPGGVGMCTITHKRAGQSSKPTSAGWPPLSGLSVKAVSNPRKRLGCLLQYRVFIYRKD